MNQRAKLTETWYRDDRAEREMGDDHAPMWRHLIELVPERDLASKAVLDYGCNQGGFLRTLHAIRPFKTAVGLDIARASVERAEQLKGTLPISYRVLDDLTPFAGQFDIGFSYEVLYLLPDLEAHTRAMHGMLKAGGSYYAVIGCHTDNPLWPRWRKTIADETTVPVYDYSPEAIRDALRAAGFAVSVRRFGYEGFISAAESSYYDRLTEAVEYARHTKLLFQATRD